MSIKILSIGYYDDFARFFLGIKKELKQENNKIELKYLSLYFSGYLYFLVRLQNVSFFSFKVWINKILNKNKYQNIINKNVTYRGIDLNEIIKYHKLLDNENELNLKLQAISYIDIIEKLFNNYKPDILILSSDSRLSIEIFDIKAKELGIKTYYFEQGPFGTTMFDNKGVNANASIRNKLFQIDDTTQEDKDEKIKKFFQRKRSIKYKRNPIYRGSDYILQFILSKIGLLPIDIKMQKEVKIITHEYINLLKNKYTEDKTIFLLVLQVPYDVNMVYHSPFYNNHFEILQDVYQNLPQNSQLLVREHPLYQGKYEKELYTFMYKNHISLDTNDLYKSIDKSDVIIVNNSTVGIEAISKLKTVVVLGNSYYDRKGICLKLSYKDELKYLLNSSLSFKSKEEKVISFLNYFYNYYLVNGHFRDENLEASKNIAKEILNDL
jgi:capsular polysaccharide export protein